MIRIEEVDPADDKAFAAFHAVYDEADRFERPDATTFPLGEMQPVYLRSSPTLKPRGYCAFDGDDLVGVAEAEFPLVDNLTLVYVGAYVLPARRREGIGSALVEHVADVARRQGRRVWEGWVSGRTVTDPEDHRTPGELFAAAHGLTLRLQNVERVLDLPVPAERLDRLVAEAAPSHADYRLVSWVDPCPPEYRSSYVRLKAAMMDEAPSGDLEFESEVWDEGRLADGEAELVAMGRTRYVVAAVAPDQTMAGHNELSVPSREPERIYQWDTLVLPEHRGHRLGLAMKVANLAVVQALHPDRTLVRTWNAESNGPMVAVNETIGFRAKSYTGEWQGNIPPAR